jgi:uncharacterized RDD family membrane protein YckC
MQNNPLAAAATPTIRRRLISMIYEAFLLFAVMFLAGLVFAVATQNRNDPAYRHALQFVLFLVMAAYFIYLWTSNGQTLAMKTWRITLIKPGHEQVPLASAAARFLLAWMWFLPALALYYTLGLQGWGEAGAMLAGGIALWAATALFDKDRQFLHDRILGTRLVHIPKQAA